MVFGRTDVERIQLNEESLWAGAPLDDNNPAALANLNTIRTLLFEGRNAEAHALATESLLGTPPTVLSYQPLMDLSIELGDAEISEYARELDVLDGVATARYRRDGARFEHVVFASAVDDVLVVHLRSERPFDAKVRLTRTQDAAVTVVGDAALLLSGQVVDEDSPAFGPGGRHMRFAGLVEARTTSGVITARDDVLEISGAETWTLVVSGATDYDAERLDFDRSLDPAARAAEIVDATADLDFESLRDRHVAEHRPWMERVILDLGASPDDPVAPTDDRLDAVRRGEAVSGLAGLYFQYGRYLLLGSSRPPGRLPANLQGVWNDQLQAIWGSDFHTNINLQMNYWPAQVTNLAETADLLVGFLDRLRGPGRVTAGAMYGADGFAIHHTTDPFGRSAVHDAIDFGMFPMAGPWLALSAWRQYEFTRDEAYLRDIAYPILRDAAVFVVDFLVEDPTGRLVTSPSYSPENAFLHPHTGAATRLTYAPTMDVQIVTELAKATIEAARTLDRDPDLRATLREVVERLPVVQIGADGTIREWIEDYEEAEPGHRHVSHLFGLHPGTQITPETPEFFAAARATLERRLENGGAGTGWSRAWTINFFARLADGDSAHRHVRELLAQSTLPNLLDTHPPFQIDGNFGGTAGIAEMLVQSHAGAIELLPALPAAWPDGRVYGLRARGGFEVSLEWDDGRLARLEIHSLAGEPCVLAYRGQRVEFSTRPGLFYVLDGMLRPE